MYTPEKLLEYPYFENISEAYELKDMLDPLTGLLRRPYIIEYANCLIRAGVPFTLGMLDLDNFKHINDTYGHSAGDVVLCEVAHGLIDALDGIGVAGRFGGDEFFFIDLKHVSYDVVKSFLQEVYENGSVIRKRVVFSEGSPFVTATTGCVIFPTDAISYASLFSQLDKCLYRGKTKGRNCYIIYVAEKHQNLEIKDLSAKGLYAIFHDIGDHWDKGEGLRGKLKNVFGTVEKLIGVSDLFYVGENGRLRSVRQETDFGDVSDIDVLMNDSDVYSSSDMDHSLDVCPKLKKAFEKLEIETGLFVRISRGPKRYGYILCAEPRNRRIWVDEQSSVLYFISRLIVAYIEQTGENLQ